MVWHDGLDQSIQLALREELQTGDLTTDAIFYGNHESEALLVAKSKGIFAGKEVFQRVFQKLDSRVVFEWYVGEGEGLSPGKIIGKVMGPTAALLKGERTALNFVQRMSGIATLTRLFVQEVEGTNAQIVDTRKTLPGLRAFDKWAVRVGGGKNHRMGLYDAVMIKDNHIDAAGGIDVAMARVKDAVGHMVKIEVEARTPEEVALSVKAGADVVLLDNMPIEDMAEMVRQYGHLVLLEASGNMGLDTVKAVAKTGVQLISVGALTHSVQAMDISFVIKK